MVSGTSIYFVLPVICHVIFVKLKISQLLSTDMYNRPPLSDIVIDNFIDLSRYRKFTELFLIPFLLPFISSIYGLSKIGYLLRIGVVFLAIRMLTTVVTDIPSSTTECDMTKIPTWLLFLKGHCHDKIFSGHVGLAILLLLVSLKFNLITQDSLYYFIPYLLLYSFYTIASRNHYTIDVLLSYLIVIPIFKLIQNHNLIIKGI